MIPYLLAASAILAGLIATPLGIFSQRRWLSALGVALFSAGIFAGLAFSS